MSQPLFSNASILVGYTPYRRLSSDSEYSQTQQHNGIEDYTNPPPYREHPTTPQNSDSLQQEPVVHVSYPMVEPRVITTQPVSRINYPQGLSECLRGLESLASTDRVKIIQFMESGSRSIRRNYEYTIKNDSEEKIYTILEQASCTTRYYESCNTFPYEMKMIDTFENEIIHLHYPFTCNCLCLCWKQSIELTMPSDTMSNYVGKVQEGWSFNEPTFILYNESGEPTLKIDGQCTELDIAYKISTIDGRQIGIMQKITSNRNPINRRYINKFDTVGVTFPVDLDVKMKALCIGAVFLIKSLYIDHMLKNKIQKI